MIYESYFQKNKEYYFMLHSELQEARPTLLFIHGLGDSHIDYLPYLHSELANYYNILIPDLLGYGKSSTADDYSFEHQIQGIEKNLDYLQKKFQIEFRHIFLIAHSMGSIHATLLCESLLKKNIRGFINVEGSITQFGSFIAESLSHAVTENNFDAWFYDFKQKKIYENLAYHAPLVRPYYASLEFCQPTAFLQNGLQMYQMSRTLTGKYTHIIGKKYAALTIPTVYCFGDSLAKETLAFLAEHHLATHYFPCQNHF